MQMPTMQILFLWGVFLPNHSPHAFVYFFIRFSWKITMLARLFFVRHNFSLFLPFNAVLLSFNLNIEVLCIVCPLTLGHFNYLIRKFTVIFRWNNFLHLQMRKMTFSHVNRISLQRLYKMMFYLVKNGDFLQTCARHTDNGNNCEWGE